jgi:hypothetical protein
MGLDPFSVRMKKHHDASKEKMEQHGKRVSSGLLVAFR